MHLVMCGFFYLPNLSTKFSTLRIKNNLKKGWSHDY